MAAVRSLDVDNGQLASCVEETDNEEAMKDEEVLTVQLGGTNPCKRSDGTYRDAEVVKFRMNKRAGREEYYVHYVGLTRRQAEWVDRTRLLLSKPVEEEEEEEDDMENGADQKVSEDEDPGSEEDEPEAKKVKVDASVNAPPLVICPDHDEKLKLFCKDDGDLCCIICRDSLKHDGHKFLPLEDAAEVYRTELRPVVSPLEEALKRAGELTTQQSEKIQQLQNTVMECRQHITSEFGSMYDFLKERKEKLLGRLQQQYRIQLKGMEANAAKMEGSRDSLKETIAVANQKVEETDHVYFLDGIKDVIKKCREQQKVSSKNAISPKVLSRGTFKGPIQYIVWKQMKSIISVPECERSVDPPVNKNSEHSQQPTPAEEKKTQSTPSNPPSKAVPESPAGRPVSTDSKPIPDIWILGSGFLISAKQRAMKGPLGRNLGFERKTCNIRWLGIRETWYGSFPRFNGLTCTVGKPDIVLFHSGSNDLEAGPLKALTKCVTANLSSLAKMYPNTVFILATMPPTPYWHGTPLDSKRKNFNSILTNLAKKFSFHLLVHHELEEKLAARYKAGRRSSPTNDEADMFLRDVKNSLQSAMLKVHEPSVVKNEKPPSEDPSSKKPPSGDSSSEKPPSEDPSSKKPPSGDSPSEKVQSEGTVKVPQPLSVTEKKEESAVTKPREIWIIGNSYIHGASLHAGKSGIGKNLGFDNKKWIVRWMGKTTQWAEVLTDLHHAYRKLGMPSIVYLHVGSNDLGMTRYELLIQDCTYDLGRLSKLFPKTQFIISTILPRLEWLSKPWENSRKRFNTTISECAKKHGLGVASNTKLEAELLNSFAGGRKHSTLSNQENTLFLTDMKLSLQLAMVKATKSSIENGEPQKEVLSTGNPVIVPDNDHVVTTEDEKAEEEEKVSDNDHVTTAEDEKAEEGEKASEVKQS